MAGPYTAKTVRRHSQASPKVEPPKQTGQGKTEEYMTKNDAPTNQPTKDLTEGVDLREAQVDVPRSV